MEYLVIVTMGVNEVDREKQRVEGGVAKEDLAREYEKGELVK